MVRREILVVFKGKQKGAITPKPERPHPPKLVCMHFTSTSTCMKFLSKFYFLTPMDYSPWSEWKFWPFWGQTKMEQILRNKKGHAHQNWFACIQVNFSETKKATLTKIGLHAFKSTPICINILSQNYFLIPMNYYNSLWSKREIWPNLK